MPQEHSFVLCVPVQIACFLQPEMQGDFDAGHDSKPLLAWFCSNDSAVNVPSKLVAKSERAQPSAARKRHPV